MHDEDDLIGHVESVAGVDGPGRVRKFFSDNDSYIQRGREALERIGTWMEQNGLEKDVDTDFDTTWMSDYSPWELAIGIDFETDAVFEPEYDLFREVVEEIEDYARGLFVKGVDEWKL